MSDELSEELREKIAKALRVPFVPIDPEEEKRFKERLRKKLTEVFGVEPIHLEDTGDLLATVAAGTELRARRAEESLGTIGRTSWQCCLRTAGITLEVWDDPEPEWLSDVPLPRHVIVAYPLPDLSDIEIYP